MTHTWFFKALQARKCDRQIRTAAVKREYSWSISPECWIFLSICSKMYPVSWQSGRLGEETKKRPNIPVNCNSWSSYFGHDLGVNLSISLVAISNPQRGHVIILCLFFSMLSSSVILNRVATLLQMCSSCLVLERMATVLCSEGGLGGVSVLSLPPFF